MRIYRGTAQKTSASPEKTNEDKFLQIRHFYEKKTLILSKSNERHFYKVLHEHYSSFALSLSSRRVIALEVGFAAVCFIELPSDGVAWHFDG